MTRFDMLRTLSLAWLLFAAIGCAPKRGVAFAALEYPMSTKTVTVGTAEIAVSDRGDGDRTLVLIHGLGSSMPAWQRNVDALAAQHRVVTIDLPGYGKSSKGNYSYSMSFFAKAVRGVVRELGLTNVVLVGHSMGGQIAITYALEYPQDVQALVLSSPAGLERFEDGEAKWLAGTITPEFTCKADAEAVWLRHAQNFNRVPKAADFMVDDRLAVVGGPDFESYCVAVSRSVAGMLDEPVIDRLRDLDVPTLVLFGDNDALIPNPFLHGGSTEKLARKGTAEIRHAELVMLERAGHMAQFEVAEQWNAAVLRFLADAKSPTGTRARKPKRLVPGASIEPLYEPGTDPDARPSAPVVAPPVEPATPPATEPAAPSPPSEPSPEPEPEVVAEPVARRSRARP